MTCAVHSPRRPCARRDGSAGPAEREKSTASAYHRFLSNSSAGKGYGRPEHAVALRPSAPPSRRFGIFDRKKTNFLVRAVGIALLTCGLLALGCSSSGSSSKPAEKPADKPAPRSADSAGYSSMAFPTGDRDTSVILLERRMPREIVVGQPMTYDIRVTNLTSNQLKEVVVRDQCAANFTLVDSSPQARVTPPSLLTWQLGDLGPGATRTIQVNGRITGPGAFTSCADVSYNSLLCDTANVVQPGLKIDLTQTPEALLCDNVCAKITVTNPGTGTTRNVKVSYTLPAGWTTDDGRTAVAYTIDVLGPGASRVFDVCGKSARTGQFAGKATATADMGLTAESGTANSVVRQPVLSIKAECPPSGLIGRNYTFAFTVRNTGDAPSDNTIVTAALPAGTVFVSADNNGASAREAVSWNLGSLRPNDTRTLRYTVRADKAGTLVASASVVGKCATQVSDRCQTQVVGVPDIGTLLTDTEGVVLVGNPHVFRYEVMNQGQVDLTNVKVVARLDDNLEFVSSTAPGQPVVRGKVVEFNLGTVPIGQRRSFTITTRGTKAGNLFITTETSATEIPRPNISNEQVNYIDR